MRYTPKPERPEELLEADDLIASESLPSLEVATPPTAPRQGVASWRIWRALRYGLDPRSNRILPTTTVWALMAMIGYAFFAWITPLLADSNLLSTAMMSAALGLGLGGTLMWRTRVHGTYQAYAQTHMFFFIALILGLFDMLPQASVFLMTGPLLAGFGLGSFLATTAGPPQVDETDIAA